MIYFCPTFVSNYSHCSRAFLFEWHSTFEGGFSRHLDFIGTYISTWLVGWLCKMNSTQGHVTYV